MKPAQHWTRKVMYREASQLMWSLNHKDLQALEVSPSVDSYWADFGFGSYRETHPFPTFDICSNAIGTRYDLIILDNVLEHVRHPRLALENVAIHLRPGGHCFIATPFLIRIHPSPVDHWRWTPTGLALLLKDAGFTRLVDVNSWGNRDCVLANLGKGWAPYHGPGMSLENNPECPVMVWALAGI